MTLELDHASLNVPDFLPARAYLETRLGFRLAVTPQAPLTHGRIFLERAYLEVYAALEQPGTAESQYAR